METNNANRISIVGMSCRFPQSNTTEDFWSTLTENKDCFLPIRDIDGRPGQSATIKAGLLAQDVTTFDADFFNIQPNEAEITDPQIRLLLEVVWEALEDAGINPYELSGQKVSVTAAAGLGDYEALLRKDGYSPQHENFIRHYVCHSMAATAARISQFFGFEGTNVYVDGACASSVVAVKTACDALRQNECVLAIACAVNLILHPFSAEGYKPAVSSTNQSMPFSEAANGFVRAEGAAALVLENNGKGHNFGRRCRGIVRGISVCYDGSAECMGTPTVKGETGVMTSALVDANLHPNQVSFLECHCTGTSVGDPIEIEAVTAVYGCEERKDTLYIGSSKGVIGHAETCSGMASIIKVLKSFEKEAIPAQPLVGRLNPKVADLLRETKIAIPTIQTSWKRENGARLAAVSNFGICGTLGHILLEEPYIRPSLSLPMSSDSAMYILALSGKTEAALHDKIEQMKAHLVQNSNIAIRELTYSVNVCRAHHEYRSYHICKSVSELARQLDDISIRDCRTIGGKLCFVYPGQGSLYVGMGRSLYDSFPIFKESFDRMDSSFQTIFGFNNSLKCVTFESTDLLTSSLVYSQAGTAVVQMCTTDLLYSLGIKPHYVIGHSFGEFAAAHAAGALSETDVLNLIVKRATLVEELVEKGCMLAVMASEKEVRRTISYFQEKHPDSWVDVACVNSPSQIVLSTSTKDEEYLSSFLSVQGFRVYKLKSNYPMHSRGLETIRSKFPSVSFSPCKTYEGYPKFLPSVDCSSTDNYFYVQTISPVNFVGTCTKMEDLGVNQYLEISNNSLLSIIKANMSSERATQCLFLSAQSAKDETTHSFLESVGELYVAGQIVKWASLYVGDPYVRLVETPFYPFQRERFWIPGSGGTNQSQLTHSDSNPEDKAIKAQRRTLSLADHPWIEQHTVCGDVLYPGAGWIVMMREQLLLWEMTYYELENVRFVAALHLYPDDKATNVLMTLTQSLQEPLRIEIHTKVAYGWIKHVTAELRKQTVNSMPALKIDRCIQKEIQLPNAASIFMTRQDIFQWLARRGYNFGCHFQQIEYITRQDNNFCCKIVSSLQIDTDANFTTLIDSALQVGIMCTSHLTCSLDTFVPSQIKLIRFGIGFKCVKVGYCQIQRHAQPMDTADLANITMYDDNGNFLFYIEGLMVSKWRPTTPQLVLRTVEDAVEVATADVATNATEKSTSSATRFDIVRNTEMSIKWGCQFQNVNTYIGKQLYLWLQGLVEKGTLDSTSFSVADILAASEASNPLSLSMQKFMTRLLAILTEDGYAFPSKENEGSYQMASYPSDPTSENCCTDLSWGDCVMEFNYSAEFLNKLPNLLKNPSLAHEILYSDSSSNYSAAKLYKSSLFSKVGEQALEQILQEIQSARGVTTDRLRILEIGAGTGATTDGILDFLDANKISFEYWFTDVGKPFLNVARERYCKFSSSFHYITLDMLKDAMGQGCPPRYFDIMVGTHCFHIAPNITTAICNLQRTLKLGGMVIVTEFWSPCRTVDLAFGHLPAYWGFNDFRTDHCIISSEKWESLLSASGFERCASIGSVECNVGVTVGVAREFTTEELSVIKGVGGGNWLLTGRTEDSKTVNFLANQLQMLSKTPVRTDEDHDYSQLEGVVVFTSCVGMPDPNAPPVLLPLIQKMYDHKRTRFVLVIDRIGTTELTEEQENPSWGYLELVGMLKVFSLESKASKVKIVELDSCNNLVELTQELWSGFDDLHIRLDASGGRHPHRLYDVPPMRQADVIAHPTWEHTMVSLSDCGLHNEISISQDVKPSLPKDYVEVKVTASSLQFKYVLLSLGKLDKRYLDVGDFAGIVTRIGDNVKRDVKLGDPLFGIWTGEALRSHQFIHESMIFPLPKGISQVAASTIPIAFMTVYRSLVVAAGLKKGENVLIHTATGGVGLAALRLAQDIGAVVFVTAGTNKKRMYLRHVVGLANVYDSRTTDYRAHILKDTRGEGVHVVLNTLTQAGFKEASLDALSVGGRFIEISRLNVWSENDIRSLRPDVKYTIINFSNIVNRSVIGAEAEALEKYVNAKSFLPLPYQTFNIKGVREAFRTFSEAHHVGKFVCEFSDWGELFHQGVLYVVVGGRGGLGRQVVKWMATQGAKLIATIGRDPVAGSCAAFFGEIFNDTGCTVLSYRADISDFTECKRILDTILGDTGMHYVGGVINAAGVLHDAAIPNQTDGTMQTCWNPKAKGTWNLHQLTLKFPLEHFVTFSSVTTVLGNPGQINHAASNGFQNSLAEYRHSIGLPATSICWGYWKESGVAVGKMSPSAAGFTDKEGLEALQTCMISKQTPPVIVITHPSVGGYLSHLHRWQLRYLSKLPAEEGHSQKNNDKNQQRNYLPGLAAQVKMNLEQAMSSEHKFQIIESYVSETIVKVVGKRYESTKNLPLDSLMKVEVENYLALLQLQGANAKQKNISVVDFSSIKTIAQQLVILLDSKQRRLVNGDSSQQSETLALMLEDSKWEPSVVTKKLPSYRIPLSQQCILLTGTTGMVAPYILQLLTQMDGVTSVLCLVRGASQEASTAKLISWMKEMRLKDSTDWSKVRVISGDLGKEELGMEKHDYHYCRQNVDVVFHAAANVNFRLDYKKGSPVREVNVIGLKRLLKLAADPEKPKSFCYMSTAAVLIESCVGPDGRKTASEDWMNIANLNTTSKLGYINSKVVAEEIMRRAIVEYKVRAKVFRLPIVLGTTEDGFLKFLDNQSLLKYMYFIRMGLMGDHHFPINVLPSDGIGRIIVDAFYDESFDDDIYNITNPLTLDELDIPEIVSNVNIGSVKTEIKQVSTKEFMKFYRKDSKDIPLKPTENVFFVDDPWMDIMKNAWKTNVTEYFVARKLGKYSVALSKDEYNPKQILKKCLTYAMRNIPQ